MGKIIKGGRDVEITSPKRVSTFRLFAEYVSLRQGIDIKQVGEDTIIPHSPENNHWEVELLRELKQNGLPSEKLRERLDRGSTVKQALDLLLS